MFILRQPVGATPGMALDAILHQPPIPSLAAPAPPIPLAPVLAAAKPCPNLPEDVKAVHQRLMEIGKVPCYPCRGVFDATILEGILSVQRHFMRNPDGVISVNGMTHKFLADWKEKPIDAGVQLPGRLKEAWDWVNPLLPDGSSCVSGFRTADDQRRIPQRFYRVTYRAEIIAKYGQAKYNSVATDLLANEAEVLAMVRGTGQLIAAPGSSPHQKGKAVDVGGPSRIDARQVEVVKIVAKAHPDLFTGKVLKERNGCVHFEIH